MTGGSFFVKRRYAGSRRETLYTHSLTSRICSNTYELFQIFLIFEFFFLVSKTQSKVTKIEYILAKRLDTTLKKFLHNRSKRFANTSQTFFDKRGFQNGGVVAITDLLLIFVERSIHRL